jgi:holo-[acyl-carrier protein] synthase
MIGIDIVKTERFVNFYEKFNKKGLKKFLNNSEIELVFDSKNNIKISTVAGFWAVKEAVSKALQTGIGSELNFHDILISKTKKNAPIVELNQKVKKSLNIKEVAVSITHDGDYTVAVAFIEK